MRAALPCLVPSLVLTLLAACTHGAAAPPPVAAPMPTPVTPTPELAQAMEKLSFMRGIWRGPATGTLPSGEKYSVTQTERMGPMLGGDIIVIEGRGYRPDGTTGFNAFAVVSYDPYTSKYEIRSYAQGHGGTFELTPTADGYVWEVPAGPGSTMRFTATVTAKHWREVGEYMAPGAPPVQTFEMNLDRVGDTTWPLDTPVTPTNPK
ncbi:MAG TPA: hypothetical protein VHE35_32625 [Kofleriaceae bacterium]|nr:hypothetical protein [Kofleriaceae bacterium]